MRKIITVFVLCLMFASPVMATKIPAIATRSSEAVRVIKVIQNFSGHDIHMIRYYRDPFIKFFRRDRRAILLRTKRLVNKGLTSEIIDIIRSLNYAQIARIKEFTSEQLDAIERLDYDQVHAVREITKDQYKVLGRFIND